MDVNEGEFYEREMAAFAIPVAAHVNNPENAHARAD